MTHKTVHPAFDALYCNAESGLGSDNWEDVDCEKCLVNKPPQDESHGG